MSYLHLPRLIFTGDFKSDVSTVNNDPAHYNNATFQSDFQEPGTSSAPNGWWNPEGGASFDFVNCKVQQITLPDNSSPADDIVVGCVVSSPTDKAGGKMVDLDPQQQSVSQLWAVTLTISTAQGELLLQGDIKPTGFRDLQFRQTNLNAKGKPPNGQALGGTWTSVLTNIEWGKKATSSPFLKKLKAVTQGNKLSLNLNAFGYYYAHLDGRFALGHILGSIGPWFEGEPELFAPARRLYSIFLSPPPPLYPHSYFTFSNFLFEKKNKRLTIDFGSGFPIADSVGKINNPILPIATGKIKEPQEYFVAIINDSIASGLDTRLIGMTQADFTMIGKVDFQTGNDWLNDTGGVFVFDGLSDDVSNKLVNHQLILLTPFRDLSGNYYLIAREAIDGYVVRADNCVQRLDYNQTNKIDIYAYQWGMPLASQGIAVSLEPPTSVTPVGPKNPISEIPGNNYPVRGISFGDSIQTDKNGCAVLSITGNPINNPRGYIDGQIYFLDYQLQNIPNDPAAAAFEPDRISIHLRDYFKLYKYPAWSNIVEIMTQYSNLYPIMSKYIVDLSDPVAVKAKKDILIFAFTRDINDPLHMPVTRDLSEAKRQAILKWLEAPNLRLGRKTGRVKKPLMASPAKPDAELTENQIRSIKATKAKSGADFLADKAGKLSEDS